MCKFIIFLLLMVFIYQSNIKLLILYNTTIKSWHTSHNLFPYRYKLDPNLQSSCRIIKNINTDEKYFVPEDGRAEFDKLSIDDMRKKKVYYDSGYKLTKGETESDLTKYLVVKRLTKILLLT